MKGNENARRLEKSGTAIAAAGVFSFVFHQNCFISGLIVLLGTLVLLQGRFEEQ